MEAIDIENLRRVWERVSSPEPARPEPPSLSVRLRGFIEGASMASGMYELLALKTRENSLRELSREERRHERALQAELFLLTGDTWPVPVRHPSAPYLLAALRESWMNEEKNAGALEALAGSLPEGRTRSLLLTIARDDRRHALILQGILKRMIY